MAEITKVTTPMVPRENLGKNRPVTEQAFELNNPGKVNKPAHDKNVMDRDPGGQALRDALGRAAVAPLLRDSADSTTQIQRMVSILQMGTSASEIIAADPMRQLLESMFVPAGELLGLLMEQDEAAMLFKGEPFNVLRELVARFENMPHVRDALVNLLKSFEFNVNLDNSIKTILYQCENLLDYMFSQDRAQFGNYLDGLANMLLPEPASSASGLLDADGLPIPEADKTGGAAMFDGARLGVEPREAAAILKGNLLPLLGEIVVKYYQNEKIRDMVMVVVHNLVRVDKGTPEALREAVDHLVEVLGRIANLNDRFGQDLSEALSFSSERAKMAGNEVVEKLAAVISQTLRNPDSSPAALRQAENLLLSLLQNQSSMMSVLHYILPLNTQDGRIYAEMYVDPDSEEARDGKSGEKGRKVFLTVESDRHGSIELCFWEAGGRVELSMWCSEILMEPLKAARHLIGELMSTHGYSMTGFSVEELTRHHSIIQVFPKLLDRKVGIDVRV